MGQGLGSRSWSLGVASSSSHGAGLSCSRGLSSGAAGEGIFLMSFWGLVATRFQEESAYFCAGVDPAAC